ncbi:PP2C family protein-serine/threonine phosphatase [Jannaschia sp. LMIT008]|uniref:PP2C family protein-serine/threonine phosphatase n=1 Tax=Jannaschia maritima TaxID=3032585 RepID=UPI002811D5BB|nr:protein phosphatase 2C domain-containing protein [Jannaschia sp. LMIT008]
MEIGLLRPQQQDAWIVLGDVGLWAVADGMGGWDVGAQASAAIADALATVPAAADIVALTEAVEDRLGQANAAIWDRTVRGARAGATVAVLLARGDGARVIWSGDSRVYRLRGGVLSRMTRDHSEVNDLLDRGTITRAEAERYPEDRVLTRAIGTAPRAELEVRGVDIAAGDVWLVCTDGLTTHLTDRDIEAILAEARAPQAACDALVDLALARGGRDNVTAIAVEAQDAAPLSFARSIAERLRQG